MADSPSGPLEYGRATANHSLMIDASFSNLNFISPSSASQLHELAESSYDFDAVWKYLSHDIDFNLGRPFPELVISPPHVHEIISSNGSGTSANRPSAQPATSASFTSACLEASTTCRLQPRVCERYPSLTFFVDGQLECLPALAESMANIESPHDPSCNTRSRHILQQNNADFSFYPNPINNQEPAEDLCTAVPNSMSAPASASSSASDMPMFFASAMDTHNHSNADAARISVDEIPKLVALGGPSQCLQAMGYPYVNHSTLVNFAESPMSYVKNMESMGSFSDSAPIGFLTASPPSISLTSQTSMAGFVGVSFSAPNLPTPSVNKGAPNESVHIIEDTGCIPGGIKVEELRKTELVKLRDKFAWRKHRAVQRGVKKRRNHSRGTSLPALDPHSLPYSSSENAARRNTDPQDMMNFTNHEDNKVMFRVKTEELALDDGYVWRKYGEKFIKGNKFTRNYLRCEESKRSGCTVVKHTQRCPDDEDYVRFLYIGRHNHPVRD